ncbi:glycosyltransferase family 4 protein [Sphingomonas morindae]|uniref:Glycosyltransferase family 4 protein n=1 Tax=Sphingomonas morindae TaxID=1541170 RepID=A0ABY4XC38_9SPHN|nr:glycosyltransferase family 4 protein [Sphingomonas morindae]USI74460.1 glycosyltransferase family 4 protein [Sphingomonas morindae]
MRLAYVINSVEGGGAALPVPALSEVLRAAGVEMTVLALTRRDGRALPAMAAAGLAVRVRSGGLTDHGAALRWLDREIAALGATHIWTSLSRATLLGQLVGLRRRLPVASWQHAAWLRPANLRLLRATRRLSAIWVADSDAVARFATERMGVPADRLMRWPIFRADAEAPRARPWRPGEPVRIGSLGRLHPVKGYDVLAEALRRLPPGLPPIITTIAGEGAARPALEAAGGLALPGYAERPGEWLAALHLYVQPSRSEGFCVAAHEAMQAGLPVLGSEVGEMAFSIVDGATGRLVPPGDPAALAAALADLLAEPERLAALGTAARARVLERYAPARFEAAGRAIVARLAAL